MAPTPLLCVLLLSFSPYYFYCLTHTLTILMSIPPTSKIIFNTPQGQIVVDLYAKEVAVVRSVIETALAGEFAGKTVVYHDNKLVTIAMPLLNFKRTVNSRLPFNKGAVGVTATDMVINLNDGVVVRDDLTVVGKIVGETVYTLNKVKDYEFECAIRESEVPVVYYKDLEGYGRSGSDSGTSSANSGANSGANPGDASTNSETKTTPETRKKPKRSKVKLAYEDEDEQDDFTMISSYDRRGKEESNEGALNNKTTGKAAETTDKSAATNDNSAAPHAIPGEIPPPASGTADGTVEPFSSSTTAKLAEIPRAGIAPPSRCLSPQFAPQSAHLPATTASTTASTAASTAPIPPKIRPGSPLNRTTLCDIPIAKLRAHYYHINPPKTSPDLH